MTQQHTQPNEDERRQLDSARKDLVAEFGERLPADEVGRRFDAMVAEFADAPVRTFVPVLARRYARQELLARA